MDSRRVPRGRMPPFPPRGASRDRGGSNDLSGTHGSLEWPPHLRQGLRRPRSPIVLLHGFPDNVHLYDRLVPHLADRRRVVTFDFLGWGASDKPTDYRPTAASQALDLTPSSTSSGCRRSSWYPTTPPARRPSTGPSATPSGSPGWSCSTRITNGPHVSGAPRPSPCTRRPS